MTNREWFNSLSDNDLAEQIYVMDNCCPKCAYYYTNCMTKECDCKEGIIKWLNAEHKENNNERDFI